MEALIEAKEIYKIYKMGQTEVKAVNGISLKIMPKEYVAITGPSGSGKTSLLDLLSCLLRPTKGEIYIEGKPVSKMNDAELAHIRGKTIGFIFQNFNLISRLSALENVALPLLIQGIPKEKREEIARKLLERLGLGNRLHHKPTELSGGQQQRVAIARALAVNPKIIVADEPTGNLDSKAGAEVLKILRELNSEGKTILLVTHEQYVAKEAHRIIKLKDGKIIGEIKNRRHSA